MSIITLKVFNAHLIEYSIHPCLSYHGGSWDMLRDACLWPLWPQRVISWIECLLVGFLSYCVWKHILFYGNAMKILGTRMVDEVFAAECKVLQKINEMSPKYWNHAHPANTSSGSAVVWNGCWIVVSKLEATRKRNKSEHIQLVFGKKCQMFLTKAIKPVVTVSVTVNLSVSVSLWLCICLWFVCVCWSLGHTCISSTVNFCNKVTCQMLLCWSVEHTQQLFVHV